MINVFNGYSDTVVTLLRDAVDAVRGPDCLEYSGLCYNIYDGLLSVNGSTDHYRGVMKLFRSLCESWPEFSGDRYYPVSCPEGGDPQWAFGYSDNKYTGSYGASRLRLADFVVDQCAQELKRRSTL